MSIMQIKIRLPEDWRGDIERAVIEAGYELEAPKGRTGGAAMWIKDLIARELGRELRDPHLVQSEKFAKERTKRTNPDPGIEAAPSQS